jgi:hypothetical protein
MSVTTSPRRMCETPTIMCTTLLEVPLAPVAGAMPESVASFVREGLRRSQSVDCFDFVPSNCDVLYAVLSALGRGRLCEWGSGMGLGIGLAEILGYDACGIEIDAALAAASRELLADFGLSAVVETGSYFDVHCDADIYFNYCWSAQMRRVQEHFISVAPDHAKLLICHGASDIRCKVKARE